jgi:hypothetical protein
MRILRVSLFLKTLATGAALCLAAPDLVAMQSPTADTREPDVETLTIQLAASRAASEARLDQRYATALRERDRIDRARRAEARRRAQAEASLIRERASREAVERRAAERERIFLQRDQLYQANLSQFSILLEELSRTNPELAISINAYRSMLAEFVANASPERRELVRRYAAGDPQALPLLQALIPLEAAARTAAAQRIAEEAPLNASRANADSYRVLGLIALDSFNRGNGGLNVAQQAWESAIAEERTRLDLLVLARISSLMANDLRAAQLLRAAEALPDDPQMNARYPLAAFFVAADAREPGSVAGASAELLRVPPTNEAIGFQPLLGRPPADPRLAPLLEQISLCERSAANAAYWTLARELADLDRETRQMAGRFAVGTPASPPSGTRPTLACDAAISGLATTLSDTSYSAVHREALLLAAVELADLLVRNGGAREAASLWAATAIFCPLSQTSEQSPLVHLSCVRAQLLNASRTMEAGSHVNTGELERMARPLETLSAGRFLLPEQVLIVASTYVLAAEVFEEGGDALGARRMLGRARELMAHYTRPFAEAAAFELVDIALADATARLEGMERGNNAAERAYTEAETRLVNFHTAHQGSLAVCENIEEHIESDLAWRTAGSISGGIDKLRRLTPVLLRCDRLSRDVFPDQTWPDHSGILRQQLALRLAMSRWEREDLDEAEIAFAYLAEISANADAETPSPNSFSTHIVSLAALSQIAARRGRFGDAARYEERAVALARRESFPTFQIRHLNRLAGFRSRLNDEAAAEAAAVDAVRLCALRIPPTRREEGSPSFDQLEERLASFECDFGVRDVSQFFEQNVASLEAQSQGPNPARLADLADALFYLGRARRSSYDLAGARDAYRRSVELREEIPATFWRTAGRTDLTPYVMARLAEFEGEEERWRTLRSWLERRQRERQLTTDEQRLFELAVERATTRVP